jgi:tetratricopeptide (TPR) repeat protein
MKIWHILFTLCLLAIFLPSCSPEGKKGRHLKRADQYFGSGEYEKAKIEYFNLLRLDPTNRRAIQQLGLIWFEQGAPHRALPFLLKSKELSPDHTKTRTALALVLNSLGQHAQARSGAIAVLEHAPAEDEAIMLLADTSRTPEEIQQSIERLKRLPAQERASVHVAIATLALREGNVAAAEAGLSHAVELEPKSPIVHLALGNFHLFQKNQEAAAKEYIMAAELAPLRSPMRIRLAEFQAITGAVTEAKAVLEEITRQLPDYFPAWRLLAQIALTEKKHEQALQLLENIIRRDHDNVEARLLEAEARLVQGDPGKAAELLNRLAQVYPKNPIIRYQLARAHLQNNSQAQATAALDQAISARPDYLEAILLRAELNLRAGDINAVVRTMADLLKKRPGLPQAELLLAEAYRLSGRLDDAARVLGEHLKRSPKSAQAQVLLGLVQRQQKQIPDARRTFEKAAELAPENPLALFQLVDIHLQEKQFDAALQRVRDQQAKTPGAAAAHFIEARVHAARSDWDKAEAVLLKTLERDPNFSIAYDLLIATYVSANKLDSAIKQLESLLATRPNNPRALMIAALIHEKKGDFQKARETYEKLLTINPEFAPALNNLAYIYAERLGDLQRASELARKARGIQPNDPSVADTLGWILYKRGNYGEALPLLQESVKRLGNVPEVQFHLGMVCYMMGQTEAAVDAWRQAVDSPENFPGRDEALQRLAFLEGQANGKGATAEQLESLIQKQPGDVMIWVRLAEAYETIKAWQRAANAYEEALKLNPQLGSALAKLAGLYAGPLGDTNKAYQLARKARDLGPADPKTGALLGRLACQTGNVTWGYSLLQESATQLRNDPKILKDFGWAAYWIGKLTEARDLMQRVVELAEEGSIEAEDARTFLTLTSAPENTKQSPGNTKQLELAESEARKALERDSGHVPALMVRAGLEEHRDNIRAATEMYSEILRRFPDFAPAQKQLAALYAADPQMLKKAHELALKARKTLPDDPDLAATLAVISYQRREYAYARQLFEESARGNPLSSKELYYLGMSQLQLKQTAEARKTLQSALAAGLSEPMARSAQETLRR